MVSSLKSLSNARLVLPDRVEDRGSIRIESGRIVSIGLEGHSRSASENDLDVGGATVFPGLIDVHIHGAIGIDVMAATSEELAQVSIFLSSQGVTSWLPTFVPAADEQYRSAVAAIETASRDPRGARIIGLHYEGPFVNSAQCGALHAEHFKTFSDIGVLDQLPIPKSSQAVKMITIAPEIEGGIALVKELYRRDWIISIGHTRADETTLGEAATAGARHMTHFMNAMPQLHHRQPGPVGWGLSRDDVTCDVIADGIHLHPLTLRMLMKAKGSTNLSLISDAIAAAGKGDGDYQIWGETIKVKDGRTSNASGNIAGSVITMFDAVRMMRSIGATEVESAQMASSNPARLLRIDHECGSIEEGKRADLVVLDDQGKVKLTIVGGKIVFP
ncbi:MAG TPA: N-acetylglucosamine-6-phosphate deacetylase [Pyrinomonadaceae bacterium]|nr:N-acetylglucosamine-6-phosphate deacetylase [Pyrinomonadaceae bacterium]